MNNYKYKCLFLLFAANARMKNNKWKVFFM